MPSAINSYDQDDSFDDASSMASSSKKSTTKDSSSSVKKLKRSHHKKTPTSVDGSFSKSLERLAQSNIIASLTVLTMHHQWNPLERNPLQRTHLHL